MTHCWLTSARSGARTRVTLPGLRSTTIMSAINKLSRSIASPLFTVTLGDTFDCVQTVPAGERPRNSTPLQTSADEPAPVVNAWSRPDGLKPSAS
jgi:hypothetical protein